MTTIENWYIIYNRYCTLPFEIRAEFVDNVYPIIFYKLVVNNE